MLHRSIITILPVFGSVLIHIMFIGFFFMTSEDGAEEGKTANHALPIKFRILPISDPANLVTGPAKTALKSNRISRKINPSSVTKYADLLPGKSFDSHLVSHKSASHSRYNGPFLAEIIGSSTDLVANFELPLAFRRQFDSGRASAYLSLHEGIFTIEALYGTKVVRAALFETLRHPTSPDKFSKIFSYFGAKNIKITIEAKTKYAPHEEHEFKTDYEVHDRWVLIRVNRFLGVKKHGCQNLCLEDEHSRRAKKLDRMKLSRLKQSLAYRKVIRNYRLN